MYQCYVIILKSTGEIWEHNKGNPRGLRNRQQNHSSQDIVQKQLCVPRYVNVFLSTDKTDFAALSRRNQAALVVEVERGCQSLGQTGLSLFTCLRAGKIITTVEGSTFTCKQHPKYIKSFKVGKDGILWLWKKHTGHEVSCHSEVCCPIYICCFAYA